MHTEERVLPPEQEVDCPCDTHYHRPVLLDSTGQNERVVACLHCGTLSYIHCETDEPHPNHVICVANRVMPLTDAAHAWLSEWPRRVYVTFTEPGYLPSAFRAASTTELAASIAHAVAEQRDWTLRVKVLRAGIPTSPPPELPTGLSAHADTWHSLQWDDQTSTQDLVLATHSGPGSAEVAGELLHARNDAADVIAEMIASFIPSHRRTALYCIYRERITSPEITAGLLRLLKTLPRNETSLEPVLTALLGLGAQAAPARPILRDLARRSLLDYYFHKRLKQIEGLIADSERREAKS